VTVRYAEYEHCNVAAVTVVLPHFEAILSFLKFNENVDII
jgi:hypothetical protein